MAAELEWYREPEPLAEEWEALADADATPFASPGWYGAWWEAFGAGELRIAALRRNGRLAAVLPFRTRGSRAALRALANWHTPVLRIAAEDDAARRELIAAVLRTTSRPVELRTLHFQDAALEAAAASGRLVHYEEGPTSPAIELAGGAEMWRAGLSRNRTRDLRKRRRRLDELPGARVYALERPSDLDAELAEGMRVEAAGWKGRRGTAMNSRPQTRTFYTRLARHLHERGALRFCGVEVAGRLIAFELMVVHGRSVFSLKGGFDEAHRDLSPGILLQVASIERAFELGLDTYEFLGAAEDWKESFSNTERPHTHVLVHPRTAAGYAADLAWRHARPLARRAVRRLRGG